MKIIVNELDPIRFRKGQPYAKRVPTFVSHAMGGRDEIARWILDLHGIAYIDRLHMPYLAARDINRIARKLGADNGPLLVMTDTLIYRLDSIVRYWEERSYASSRIIPDGDTREQVLDLYRLFAERLDGLVQRYLFGRLIDEPSVLRKAMRQRTPFLDRLAFGLVFPIIRRGLIDQLHLPANTPEERLTAIQNIFARVSHLLSDRRRYLCGNKITIADIAFASAAAPVILPEEFGGVIPQFKQIPLKYRDDVIALRSTAAGQFILRLYQEDRPPMIAQAQLPAAPGLLSAAGQRVSAFVNARLPAIFSFLQDRFPVAQLPLVPLAAVTRKALLVEMLNRDTDFTIEEINSRKMASQKGAFFLGWDRTNPQFGREREFAKNAVLLQDLKRIREFIRESCDQVLRLNRNYGRVDVANTLCRPVLVRLLDSYFGIAAPNDRIMMEWLRLLFYDLFLNFAGRSKIHAAAVEAGIKRRDWVKQVIVERLTTLGEAGSLPDNVLNRMILLSRKPGYEWVDEDVINRSIGGLITGIFETTNKAVVNVLAALLDRPEVLEGAIKAAHENDMERMYGYVSESLRMLPVQPGVLRYCAIDQALTGGGSREYTVRGGSYVLAMTAAAMFDPTAFPDPKAFNPGRIAAGAHYMNWGFGLHECFGRHINTVTIAEFTAAVLRLRGIRRSEGMAGRGVGLKTLGFPNNFVLSFDVG